MYTVTEKFVIAAGAAGVKAPGEHYTLVDETCSSSWFREVHFYRSSKGSEAAIDGTNTTLLKDGELFRFVKAAVEKYDQNSGGK